MTLHPSIDPAGKGPVAREVLLYGWLENAEAAGSRPQDTTDAILVRTEGDAPRIRRRYRIGSLEVALVVGDAVDVEPLPTARAWRGVVLGYVVEGTLSVAQGGQEVALARGDFAFYTGAQRYRITSPGPHTYLVVRIPTASIALRHSSFADVIATDLSRLGSAGVLRAILAELATLPSEPSLAASAHLGDALVAASHAVIADARAPGTAAAISLFNTFVIWLEEHLDDTEVSAEHVAAAHFLSPRYVRRVFAANGTTVSRLVRQRRLERIRDELVAPENVRVSIGTIAGRWAMADSAAFSRAFSAHFGVSPRRYRALHLRQGQPGAGDWNTDAKEVSDGK